MDREKENDDDEEKGMGLDGIEWDAEDWGGTLGGLRWDTDKQQREGEVQLSGMGLMG